MPRAARALFAGLIAIALTLTSRAPEAAGSQAPPAPSPRNASYQLQASLDPASHTIAGTGRLTWRNISRNPASELQFHLYWNAWRDRNSTWMREQLLGRSTAFARRPSEDFGGITVTRMAIAGTDLASRATFIAPDDGNPDDRTVLRLPLDRPVAPGETVDVDLAWTSIVPRTFARTGRLGGYYFIAQWFPKIGVLEDAGWNTRQFHAATEFFADFGTYDVSLTVPAGWLVGATGRVQSATPADGGRTVHRFVQDDVHDFAWTTSPTFVERRERFEEPGLPAVDMRLLLQAEHAGQEARHFAATRAALKHYGTWFGPYPYGHITIVDPATIFNAAAQGDGTRGMEYPTLFTAGTRFSAPIAGAEPEGVTVHETGHQFFQGMVATNEFDHAWMDEGLNTYATARVMEEAFLGRFVTVGRYFGGFLGWPFVDVPWSREGDGLRLNGYRLAWSTDSQSTPTWRQWPGGAREIAYNKTALWLGTLERMVGWPVMRRILATHFERGRFRHPTPDEFFAIVNEVSGQDLQWFVDAVHRSSATFDYASGPVTSTPREGGGFDHTVVVRRLGEGIFPTVTRVTFADGSSMTDRWDGQNRWHLIPVRHAQRIRTVEVDPNRVLLLDLNYTNNSWSASPRASEASRKWAWRWLTWMQELLLTYGFFA